MRYYVLVVIVIGLYLPAIGQLGERGYYKYTTENGLPSNTVYKLFQDSRGLVWIATDAGVCNFDGSTFEVFTKEDGLPSSDILDIAEDKQGRIWFEAFEQSVCFYYKGQLHNSENITLLEGLNTQVLNNSHYPTEQGMWIQGDTAFFLFTGDTVYRYPRSYPESNITEKNISEFYGKTDKGMLLYSRRGIYEHVGDTLNYKVEWDADSVIWITAIGDTIYYLNDMGVYQYFNGVQKRIYSEEGVSYKHYYFLSNRNTSDIWLADFRGNVIKLFKRDGKINAEHFNLNYHITHALKDNEGNTWISTQENGLLFFSKYNIKTAFESDTTQLFSCAYDQTHGTLYVGMDKGNIAAIGNSGNYSIKVNCSAMQSTNRIASLLAKDELWIGSDCFFGYVEFGENVPQNRSWKNAFGAVKDLLELDGNIYVASSSGILKCNRYNSTVDSIYTKRAFTLCADDMGNVLIAERSALYKLPDVVNPFIKMPKNAIPKKVAVMGEHIILATYDAGIYFHTKDSIIHLTAETHLLSNFCSDLVIQNDSTFWYSSNEGVGRITFDQDKLSFDALHLTSHEGLIDNDILDLELAKGQLFAAGHKAVVSIPLELNDDRRETPIFFTNIKTGDKTFVENEEVILGYKHAPLKVKFRGINYTRGPQLKYRYRLLGQNDNWFDADKNELTFLSLPPGEYQLQVSANTAHGQVLGESPIIKLIVVPPYWQTPVFYLYCFIGLVLIFAISTWFIIRMIKRREEEKTRINSRIALSDLKALQMQMNPHFIYNSLTSIQNYIQTNEKENANRYLTKFARLMRLVLDSSRSPQITLEDEIKLLENYIELEKLRLNHSFTYEIVVDNTLQPERTYLPPLFIQPLVENAIKHGLSNRNDTNGQLGVTFQVSNDELVVTVSNNSAKAIVDMEAENNTHRSHSLGITQDRITNFNSLYNYNIRMKFMSKQSSDEMNTTVRIYLPLLAE